MRRHRAGEVQRADPGEPRRVALQVHQESNAVRQDNQIEAGPAGQERHERGERRRELDPPGHRCLSFKNRLTFAHVIISISRRNLFPNTTARDGTSFCIYKNQEIFFS